MRTALGVGRGLVVLDLLPFTVAGHVQLGGNCVAVCRACPDVVEPASSCTRALSSARDASSNCPTAAFTRSSKAIAQRARSCPVKPPENPERRRPDAARHRERRQPLLGVLRPLEGHLARQLVGRKHAGAQSRPAESRRAAFRGRRQATPVPTALQASEIGMWG